MSNEKLGAEQGRGTLQAIAQEIVANLGSCDASSDLGFKVIWATLDRHFGTGPKQAEQVYHARGAGREALQKIFDNDDGCGCECNSPECCNVVGEFCPHCIAQTALREPGADTGTTPPPQCPYDRRTCDEVRATLGPETDRMRQEQLASACHSEQAGSDTPASRERLDEARWWHARIGLNHGMKWCCERIEELERAAAERGTTPWRETAWLIERHDMTRTQWLCCDSGEFEWTADPLKPLRLARREDAEQLALLALPNRDDIDVRITEHQWGDVMLSYMKCGKTECEKPRLLEKAFCEEHAAAARETAQPLINQKIPLDECLVEYRNNGSQLFMRFEDETVLRFELAERGTTPPEGLDWWTEAAADVVRHARTDSSPNWQNAIVGGLLRAYNRGQDAATQRAPVEQVQPAVANIDLPRNEFEAAWAHYASTAPGTATEKNVFMAGWNAAAPDHAREGALR